MNETLKQIIPMLATALGGPLAGAATSFIADKLGVPPEKVKDIVTGVTIPPEQQALLKQAEFDFQIKMAETKYANVEAIEKLNASVVTEVNTTMRAEAASEHWPTYSWRPFIGFTFGAYINSMWLLPLFKLTPVVMSPDLVLAVGGILGVASWFRGKAQATPEVPTVPVSMKG